MKRTKVIEMKVSELKVSEEILEEWSDVEEVFDRAELVSIQRVGEPGDAWYYFLAELPHHDHMSQFIPAHQVREHRLLLKYIDYAVKHNMHIYYDREDRKFIITREPLEFLSRNEVEITALDWEAGKVRMRKKRR